ncbi:hypothetical protein B9Z55_004931 [Caenorhabditis nigoni]|uniref:Uncharacterized protein n=1 Tax=Caenorhabditis nigoni TaxID=1611254 RepID=A0A2G5UYL9_9PELO|nr:hypothetical protein B9Z55_004931 [Caenorhabditis nigoni]
MLLPTLFQLAAKSVAQQIHDKEIPLNFDLGSKASNELSRLKELDLSQCKRIDVEEILNLKNFKLNSLEFGDLYHLKVEFPHPQSKGSLLAAEVRMQNLEFLDCSMTFFEDHELKKFVEHHPNLKTVVAICMFYFITSLFAAPPALQTAG